MGRKCHSPLHLIRKKKKEENEKESGIWDLGVREREEEWVDVREW